MIFKQSESQQYIVFSAYHETYVCFETFALKILHQLLYIGTYSFRVVNGAATCWKTLLILRQNKRQKETEKFSV